MKKSDYTTVFLATSAVAVIMTSIFFLNTADTTWRRTRANERIYGLLDNVNDNKNRTLALKQLLDLSLSDYEFEAMKATIVLGDIRPNIDEVTNQLGDLLSSKHALVRREAALSLSRVGSSAKSQLKKIAMVLADPKYDQKPSVLIAVEELGSIAIELLPILEHDIKVVPGSFVEFQLPRTIKSVKGEL